MNLAGAALLCFSVWIEGAEPAAPLPTQSGTLNINAATQEELATLPGIGPKLAQRITERRSVAMFRRVADLRKVKGLGAKRLKELSPFLTVEGPSTWTGSSTAKGPSPTSHVTRAAPIAFEPGPDGLRRVSGNEPFSDMEIMPFRRSRPHRRKR